MDLFFYLTIASAVLVLLVVVMSFKNIKTHSPKINRGVFLLSLLSLLVLIAAIVYYLLNGINIDVSITRS